MLPERLERINVYRDDIGWAVRATRRFVIVLQAWALGEFDRLRERIKGFVSPYGWAPLRK